MLYDSYHSSVILMSILIWFAAFLVWNIIFMSTKRVELTQANIFSASLIFSSSLGWRDAFWSTACKRMNYLEACMFIFLAKNVGDETFAENH